MIMASSPLRITRFRKLRAPSWIAPSMYCSLPGGIQEQPQRDGQRHFFREEGDLLILAVFGRP